MNNTNKNKIIRVKHNNEINSYITSILLWKFQYTLKLDFGKITFSFLYKKFVYKNINSIKNHINFICILNKQVSEKLKKLENLCIKEKKQERMQNSKVEQICII